MSNPVAIITGAGRGIGREVAIQLAALNHQVVGLARTAADLQETAARAPGMLSILTDVTDSKAIQSAIDQTLAAFGRIDAVIHCAGVAPFLTVEQMTDDQWLEILNTNLSAAFYLARAAWPIMKKQGGGVLVNVSSISARDPFESFSAYGAAKAGVNMFGWVAAREGQPHNIRVHTVAPGAVETSMFRKLLSEKDWPTEKCLSPADVARTIILCVTGELRHTSGEVIWMQQKFE